MHLSKSLLKLTYYRQISYTISYLLKANFNLKRYFRIGTDFVNIKFNWEKFGFKLIE